MRPSPRLLLSCLLISLPSSTLGGRILVYSPSISISHLISNGRIADTLADAGHEVVMFILEYSTAVGNFTGAKKAKVITMHNLYEDFDEYLAAGEDYFGVEEFTPIAGRVGMEDALMATCQKILERRQELEVLRAYNFDVAFSEQLDTCGAGIIRYLGIQNHLWISTTAMMEANSYRLGIPQPSSYVPTIEENDNNDVMGFWQRSSNLWMYFVSIGIHRYGADGTTKIFRQHLGASFPHTGDIVANSSLCFVNTDEQFDLPRPFISKTIHIGGIGIKEPHELNDNYSRLMAKGKKGVIIMSLGTIAPFYALPKQTQEDVIAVFRRFTDYHFILKITKEDTTTAGLINGMSNVDLVVWMPQSDLLGHPRLRLFIMHGGLNGLMEAAHRGVPLIVIPFFADQFRNGRLVEKRHMGKAILKKELNAETLGAAVKDVLNDPSYKAAAQRISKLLRTRPFPPEERLVKWTEFAIENGVLDHLHLEGSRMNSIIYFNLDVFAAVLLVPCIVLILSYWLLKTLCSKPTAHSIKSSTKKKVKDN